MAGLCLLAPYPGTGDVLREIEAAGGLRPLGEPGAAFGCFRADLVVGVVPPCKPPDRLPVWVGLAQGDRFIRASACPASLLPPAQVDEIEGDRQLALLALLLWQRWLERGWLPVLPEAG